MNAPLKPMTLKDLRVWHWRVVLFSRKKAQDKRASRATVEFYNRQANFHLGAVQAMNDIPELQATTAEQDAAE